MARAWAKGEGRGRGGGGSSEGWGEGRGPVVRAVVRVDNGSEKVIYITR